MGPTLYCFDCCKTGHEKSQCPANIPPTQSALPEEEQRLPPMTSEQDAVLTKTLKSVTYGWMISNQEVLLRNRKLEELKDSIRYKFPDADLTLIGSTINGFGSTGCDMDISMTLRSSNGLNLGEKKAIVKTLSRHLQNDNMISDIQPITTAKVPIVKFYNWRVEAECDISIDNKIAVYNSNLLRAYTRIDPRVAVLGCNMKRFAKACDICDVFKGGLSSYAYTLMVIYFLQQRERPVLPVLQELYKGDQPADMIEQLNTCYTRDGDLTSVWNLNKNNQESISELWTALLTFFTEEFSVKDIVISIRQKDVLTKEDKNWLGPGFSIEDPFNLTHDLGRGLAVEMQNYIKECFTKARRLFSTPLKEPLPHGYEESCPERYFFSRCNLTEGKRPKGSGLQQQYQNYKRHIPKPQHFKRMQYQYYYHQQYYQPYY